MPEGNDPAYTVGDNDPALLALRGLTGTPSPQFVFSQDAGRHSLSIAPIPPIVIPGIQNDTWISWMAKHREMISPFADAQVRSTESGERVISYGVSSYGYDARLADEFKVFSNIDNPLIDPKEFTDNCFVSRQAQRLIIPPHGFVLARTLEYFKIPNDTLVICLGKSTYARCGLLINVTPLEPGWEGHVTLEISNTTPIPAVIYAFEGICQFLFFRGAPCEINYAQRNGKYMGQRGVTTARP